MLRVVHVTESITARAGGTSTAFVELIEALRTQSDRVHVRAITTDLPAGDEAARWIAAHDPATWIFTGPPGRFRPGALAEAAINLINRGGVDLLHLHGLWLIDLVAIAAAARRQRIPVVWQPHGMLVRAALQRSRLKKQLFLHLGLARELRHSDAAVFTSETERDTSDLARLGPSTRREILPLPVAIPFDDDALPALRRAGRKRWLAASETDPSRTLIHGSPKPDLNTPLLVFMGRLHPVKRLELAIPALALIRKEAPDTRLLLIGDGDDAYVRTLKDLARAHGVQDALIFAGWLNSDEKWQALAAGDALLIQSEFENFGYAIAEALVAGTPVVATSNLSLAPAVAEIGAGASAAPNPEAIAAAVLSVITRGDQRDMGLRGRRWVEANFSRQAVGERLVTFYSTLAPSRSGGPSSPSLALHADG